MASLQQVAMEDPMSQDHELTDILNLFGGAVVSNALDDPSFSGSLDSESGSSRHANSNSGSEPAILHAEAPATSLQELHMQAASHGLRTFAEGHGPTQGRSHNTRYTTEAKLARNREAQRRFKLKQKVLQCLAVFAQFCTQRCHAFAPKACRKNAQHNYQSDKDLFQQAQTQSFKDQLAVTTASLHSLEQQRHKLLSKNALLNKIMQLQVKPLRVPSIDDVSI